jgi:glycosyltransferase involved in cell wall biosynthesis
VIPRAIDAAFFATPRGIDPFAPTTRRGARLLVVCRHAREKSLDRLLRIFAEHIAPKHEHATLTLVGDGPEHSSLKRAAQAFRIAHRTFFAGEQPQQQLANWYANADLFVYTSLSETYGQVVTEALWNGLPVVAFADDMGVSGQLAPGRDGELIAPGPDTEPANAAFAQAVLRLLAEPGRHRAYATEARARARDRADAHVCIARYRDAFAAAREHRVRTALARPLSDVVGFEPIARWTSTHAMLAALGLLRAPAAPHRSRVRSPNWYNAAPAPDPTVAA